MCARTAVYECIYIGTCKQIKKIRLIQVCIKQTTHGGSVVYERARLYAHTYIHIYICANDKLYIYIYI